MLYDRGLMAIASSPLGRRSVSRLYHLFIYEVYTLYPVSTCQMRRVQLLRTLVDKVRQGNIGSVHCVKPIRILHPVLAEGRPDGGAVDIDVVKPHGRSIHNVDGPQGRILHVDWLIDQSRPRVILYPGTYNAEP